MLLRDPVHGLIEFEGQEEALALAIMDTREVQRLRRIRQLGLTSFVFLGAEHSRFAHAVGAAHVMSRFLRRIERVQGKLPMSLRLDEEARADAFAAAMLHDLGHGPLSHLFEEVQPGARRHERWTSELLRDETSEVAQTLDHFSAGMHRRVAALLEGDYRLPYLASAISGSLDVDRADYLLRDSHMTGVRYGLYDLDWLLRALTFAEHEEGFVLAVEGRKGLPPVESFFLGRQYMYHQVYHHKATRAAEALIRALFVRLGELVREDRAPALVPIALTRAARGESVSVAEYVALDDPALMHSFAHWAAQDAPGDPLLASFAADLLARRLPKTIPLDEVEEARWPAIEARAKEVVGRAGLRANLLVWLDVASDVPYEESDAPGTAGAKGIGTWVHLSHQPLQRLGDVSFMLGQLRGKVVKRPRLIFPAALRAEIEAAISPLLDEKDDKDEEEK